MSSIRGVARVLTIVTLAATAVAQMDLYGLVEDYSGVRKLVRMDPENPAGAQVIAEFDVDLNWLEYDRANDWLVAARGTQLYHIDTQTGVATAFASPTGVDGGQGLAYIVPEAGLYAVTGDAPGSGVQTAISKINADGTATFQFDLSTFVDDLDELMWDPVNELLYGIDGQNDLMHTIAYEDGIVMSTTNITQGRQGRGSIHWQNGLIYEGEIISNAGYFEPVIRTRDPITGDRIATLGQIPDAEFLWGLAFVPEPSTALLLLFTAPFLGRRR
ncbi:MAG: hypothetical protein JXO22_08650 [Phycisphaerae bacterium]|nr:hypothetical protein [Phycisphaerae bacterium]